MNRIFRTSSFGRSKEKGFAILFAVLTGSVLLSIGISIFNLTVKELILSSSGRESQFAFYAADTGAECALYWDINAFEVFATSTSNNNPNPAAQSCVDSIGAPQVLSKEILVRMSDSASTRFSLTIPVDGGEPYCATIIVTKRLVNGIVATEIDSRGYNTCDVNDRTRVERALRVTY